MQATTIGERIRQAHLARGLTQEDLAERAEMALSTIARIEGGQRAPRPSTLQRLATALEVSPLWLMLGDESSDGT